MKGLQNRVWNAFFLKKTKQQQQKNPPAIALLVSLWLKDKLVGAELHLTVVKCTARTLPTPCAIFCPGAGCIQSSFVRNIILKGALGSFKMKDVFYECKNLYYLVLNFILFPTGFMTTRGQKVARGVRLFQTSKESIYSLVLYMNQLCEYFFSFHRQLLSWK